MWQRGIVQYPERMEPVEVPFVPPSIDYFKGYEAQSVNKPKRNYTQNVNVFALPQWIVPQFKLTQESIQFKRRYITFSENELVREVTAPVVSIDWLGSKTERIRRKGLVPTDYVIEPFVITPEVPALSWKPSFVDIVVRRINKYPTYKTLNWSTFTPPVIPAPALSWKPNIPAYIWSRRLPVAAFPYKDARDVNFFTNPPIPFDPNAKLVAIVDVGQTWESHFVANSWANIQDQINAGYPLYCQPTLTNGYYEEIVDFGSVFDSTIVGLRFNSEAVAGTVVCQPQLSYSVDGITYTPYENTTQLFAASLRYVKFRLVFTSTDDLSVAYYSNIQLTLSVRRETDQGRVDALASDVNGTLVTFNKSFRDVESITATPQTTNTYYTVIDFVDIPNPTEFRVYVFDNTGTRVSATVDWIARGIA